MAIKVTTPETKQEPKPFPKLMKLKGGGVSDNTIALFKYTTSATIVLGVGGHKGCEGLHYEGFTPEYWEDYNEPITIQNA